MMSYRFNSAKSVTKKTLDVVHERIRKTDGATVRSTETAYAGVLHGDAELRREDLSASADGVLKTFHQMGSYPKHRCLQAGRQISIVAKVAAKPAMASRQIRRGCIACFFTFALEYFKWVCILNYRSPLIKSAAYFKICSYWNFSLTNF